MINRAYFENYREISFDVLHSGMETGEIQRIKAVDLDAAAIRAARKAFMMEEQKAAKMVKEKAELRKLRAITEGEEDDVEEEVRPKLEGEACSLDGEVWDRAIREYWIRCKFAYEAEKRARWVMIKDGEGGFSGEAALQGPGSVGEQGDWVLI